MANSKGSGNGKTGDGGKKYRHRLTDNGKAMVDKESSIIIIVKDKNKCRAKISEKADMLCPDTMKNLLPWLNANYIMETHRSNLINFRFILDIITNGENLRLKLDEGLWGIVSKDHIKEFRRKNKRYQQSIS